MIEENNRIFEQVKAPVLRPIHPRGVLWVGIAALLTAISILAGWDTTGLWLLITAGLYICFRDPVRVMPIANSIAAAPADGILTRVARAAWPAETEMDGEATCLTINPRFYDVHVLRAPATAALTHAQHVMGQWGSNVFDKNSPGNERAVFLFKLDDGRMIAMEVIAGGMAERMRATARSGDRLSLGQAMGYSAFGGEVRLYLPSGIEVIAQPGQRMIAGETAIAALDAESYGHGEVSNDVNLGVLPNSAGYSF
ncbi:MAG TPA: phosphatidylserine decarboxylase [Alphaproteobacteria bacterium]|nr:phosphatidylserine decarboxylase [Alphaproteobacteria bacterium]